MHRTGCGSPGAGLPTSGIPRGEKWERLARLGVGARGGGSCFQLRWVRLSSSSTAKKAGDEGGGGQAGGREILEGRAPWGSAGSRERALSLSLCPRSGTRRAQLVII